MAGFEEYRNRILGLLGDRAPLDILTETPPRLSEIVRDTPARLFFHRPFPGKWTATEIIGHLADAEWAFGYRTRAALGDDEPTLIGFDQEKWVVAQNHQSLGPAEHLAAYMVLRRVNLNLWNRLSSQQLERSGRHSERGPESIGMMLRMAAGHDLSHLDQIKRYLAESRHQLG